MIRKIFVFAVLLSFTSLFSQEVFMQFGKNSTSYDFTTSNNVSGPDYRSGSGDFYEIGYKHKFDVTAFDYRISLTYNQYNAAASSGAVNYSWNTSYLGIQNLVGYTFFESDNGISFLLKAGFNTAHIIKGEQFINTTYYNIKNQDEFSGIILQPIFGININYNISDQITLSLGYNFSKAFNLSNSSDEKLSFNVNQIQFGLYFPIN